MILINKEENEMKRVLVLLLSVVMTLAFMLPAMAADVTNIEFWTVLTGGDGDTMQSIVDQFNAENPDVQVTHVPMDAASLYEKMTLAVQTHSEVADVCLGHFNHIPQLAADGIISDITFLTENGVDLNNYPQWIIDAITFDDLVYGVPFDLHGVVAWANMDLLEKYGLTSVTEDRCVTFDELAQCYEAVSATGDNVYIANYYNGLYLYLRLYQEKSGKSWTDEEGNLDIDLDIFTEVIKDLRALNEKGYVPPVDEAEKNLFINGQLLFYSGGTWAKAWIEALDMNFMELVPMCYSPDTGLISVNSHQFIQPMDDERTEEEDAAVAKFVTWMGEHSDIWAEKAGQMAVHSKVINSETAAQLPQYFLVDPNFEGHTMLLNYYYISLLETAIKRIGLDPMYDLTIDPASVGASMMQEINDALLQK